MTGGSADGAGSVVGTYAYDAFGSVRAHTGATTEWSYTGEQNDLNGLVYLRARQYDPGSGRFLSRDPFAGFARRPQSLNRYLHVANRPVQLVDRLGLCGLSSWGDFGDCLREVGDYFLDKGQDLMNLGARRFLDPRGILNYHDYLAFGISLFSVGDRRTGPLGFVYYENCRGLCELVGLILGDPQAYVPGYIAFAPGQEIERDTVTHEYQHYLQSLFLGPVYLPSLGVALAIFGYRDSPFEQDARRAEEEGPHFPFSP